MLCRRHGKRLGHAKTRANPGQRLGWSLRRIQEETGIHRDTAGNYLKAAGIPIRAPRTRRPPPKPASEASTDSWPDSKPASEVSTDSGGSEGGLTRTGGRSTTSACEPYRDFIEQSLLTTGQEAFSSEVQTAAGCLLGYFSLAEVVDFSRAPKLAGPGQLPRLRGPVRQRQTLRAQAAWRRQRARGVLRDHHRPGRGVRWTPSFRPQTGKAKV